MQFSLVLATLNRTSEVKHFLETLSCQTYRNFELIVVDQNPDDRLLEILKPYQEQFAILHIRSAKGLSHARNIGLKYVSGDIVAFPDDDCYYSAGLLDQVNRFFEQSPEWDGITGRPEGNSPMWDKQSGAVTSINVWRRGISYTIFLRRAVVEKVGHFDETLGVGAGTPWGSGEESDYLLRVIEAGFQLYYDASLTVFHPFKPAASPHIQPQPSQKSNHVKTYSYALGRGRVLRKHQSPLWFVIYSWGRPFVGVVLSMFQGKFDRTQSYWATLQGRVQGWLGRA